MGKTINFLLSWQLKKLEVSLKPNCLKQDSSLAGFFCRLLCKFAKGHRDILAVFLCPLDKTEKGDFHANLWA